LPRSAMPGLAGPVTIRWNDHLVPWIEAGSDADLAFALGVVHGHLRGAQIALLRMIARGRLAEIAGPLATDIDHALRILDFGRAAPEIERRWPPATREFMERFVAGLNRATLGDGSRPPPEFALLGLTPEPYTAADILAIGRLAGTDISWLTWFSLLGERGSPGFARTWQRVLEAGASLTPPDEAGDARQAALGAILAASSRGGSNTVAVAPRRSATGAALIASDPHLGLSLPNLWLIVGMRSPGLHAVGMMVPGLPIIGLGRNPDVAWGGTNLRAASSDLFDVSRLPPEQIEAGSTRIRQRLWFPATRPVRSTPHGPIVTDAAVVPRGPGDVIALRWAGHEPTDEVTALLAAARARSAAEFRESFAGFGVSPQNMLYVDRHGTIGRVTAATLPARVGFPAEDPVLDPRDSAWGRLVDARQLPRLENPAGGVLASSNENPATWAADPPPIGWFFSDGDRLARLHALLAARPRVGVEDLFALQRDTLAPKAALLARALLARLDALPGGPPEPATLARLRGWNGDYAAESEAALVFELILGQIVPRLRNGSLPGRGPETGWNFITTFLLRDLDALPAERRDAVLREAASAAAPLAAQYRNWGEVHRLRAAHWLVNLPVLGRRFVIESLPVGGSRETPMKTGHGLVQGPHEVSFGSMARHVSDMADPDANWFVLFGGQDGWLGSAAFADQLPLWRDGRAIRLPLRPETVAREFPRVTVLRP
ncbi:MAG: penicillin acylase family protein, partial [Acetobacteraceae bacterium]|nr:penicillin acylase family protein [Acetobacteraceae bacterium]